MNGLVQDLRYAVRQLHKSPTFTISAILTLAMAIGANAVVFSVLNGLILRPLNVPQPESLYSLQHTSQKDTNDSYPNYLDDADNRFSGQRGRHNRSDPAMNDGKIGHLIHRERGDPISDSDVRRYTNSVNFGELKLNWGDHVVWLSFEAFNDLGDDPWCSRAAHRKVDQRFILRDVCKSLRHREFFIGN